MEDIKIELTQAIRKLEIVTRNLVTNKMVGKYKSVFKGRGLEFESFRNYSKDDDAGVIDWKASVRANKILVKDFVEERNIDVFFLIDASSSMIFGSTKELKLVYAAELTASLSYVISKAGDSTGFAMFSDKIIEKSVPSLKKNQFYHLSKALINPHNYGGGKDFEGALKFCMSFLKKGSILIIVSDFIGMDNNWEGALKIASRKLDVIGIMVRDPRDREIPENSGTILIEDSMSEKQLIIETSKIRDDYKSYVKKNEEDIKQSFLRNRSDLLILQTDESFLKPLRGFFKMRGSRWR